MILLMQMVLIESMVEVDCDVDSLPMMHLDIIHSMYHQVASDYQARLSGNMLHVPEATQDLVTVMTVTTVN